jgi:hypothetical protein
MGGDNKECIKEVQDSDSSPICKRPRISRTSSGSSSLPTDQGLQTPVSGFDKSKFDFSLPSIMTAGKMDNPIVWSVPRLYLPPPSIINPLLSSQQPLSPTTKMLFPNLWTHSTTGQFSPFTFPTVEMELLKFQTEQFKNILELQRKINSTN